MSRLEISGRRPAPIPGPQRRKTDGILDVLAKVRASRSRGACRTGSRAALARTQTGRAARMPRPAWLAWFETPPFARRNLPSDPVGRILAQPQQLVAITGGRRRHPERRHRSQRRMNRPFDGHEVVIGNQRKNRVFGQRPREFARPVRRYIPEARSTPPRTAPFLPRADIGLRETGSRDRSPEEYHLTGTVNVGATRPQELVAKRAKGNRDSVPSGKNDFGNR